MTDSSRIATARYHAFRPKLVVELAAEPRAEGAGDCQQNTEAADPEGVPAEGARGIMPPNANSDTRPSV